jgi:hypothetical protein
VGFGAAISGKVSLDGEHMPMGFELESKIEVSRAESLNAIPGLISRGSVKSALKLNTLDMKKISMSGVFDFDRFAFAFSSGDGGSSPQFLVEDVNGQVPIAQSIVIPNGLIPFLREQLGNEQIRDRAHLEHVADFDNSRDARESGRHSGTRIDELEMMAKRYLISKSNSRKQDSSKVVSADYSSVRDFFPNRRAISIKKVIVANLEMSEITLDIEWREGMVGLNEFMIGLLGGQMQGNLQVTLSTDIENILKKPIKIDRFIRKMITNVQVTRLDTRKILDRISKYKDYPSRNISLFADPYIDATVHGLWNLESRDLAGGIDITTIGKEQVRMLLSYIDPTGNDPTINDIRKGLYIGEVRQVSIPIKNGEIGLDVEIKALSLPIPTPKLSRFPISQLIDNAMRSQSS